MRLETRFGPVVRQMGPWNSDGVFGYESIPLVAVEKAAETIADPGPLIALPRLRAGADENVPRIVGGPRFDFGR